MRIVFCGPSVIDDPDVHQLMRARIEIAKDIAADLTNLHPYPGEAEYGAMLKGITAQSLIREVACVTPTSYGVPEETLLSGSYTGHREFQDIHLPDLRANMNRAIGDEALVHVDFGRSLGALYAAYFATLNPMASLMVTINAPRDGKLMRHGGDSVYAQNHAMIRRRLIYTVLQKAEVVFVSHEPIAAHMANMFPRLRRPYAPDPLAVQASEAEAEDLSSKVQA